MFFTRIRWFRIADSLSALSARIPERGVLGIHVNQKNICLVSSDGEIHAVRDKCPHQGLKLSHGGCAEDGKIVCPWHRYAFDLKTGRGAGLYVDVYPVEERADGVYIGFEYKAWW